MREIRLTLKFGEQFHIKLSQLMWKLQNMQALVQKSFAVIANMADDLYKNRTEKDEKVISQTIKDSIRKCADAAVFLGKINQDILNLRREKIAPELNQNYKQLTFILKQRTTQNFYLEMISLRQLKILVKRTKLSNL